MPFLFYVPRAAVLFFLYGGHCRPFTGFVWVVHPVLGRQLPHGLRVVRNVTVVLLCLVDNRYPSCLYQEAGYRTSIEGVNTLNSGDTHACCTIFAGPYSVWRSNARTSRYVVACDAPIGGYTISCYRVVASSSAITWIRVCRHVILCVQVSTCFCQF